jgi:hypothetical protein
MKNEETGLRLRKMFLHSSFILLPFLKWFWKGCKPNFVCALADGENHLSWQPIPETCFAFTKRGAGSSSVSYLALHPMGFSVPRRLRSARCALTAPFHPCHRLAPMAV